MVGKEMTEEKNSNNVVVATVVMNACVCVLLNN